MTTIQTPRLPLRPLQDADVHNLYELTSGTQVTAAAGNGQPYALEQTCKFIAQPQEDIKKFGYGVWAVVDRNERHFIGWAGFVPI